MANESSILKLWRETLNHSLRDDSRLQRDLRNEVVRLLKRNLKDFLCPTEKCLPDNVLAWWEATHGGFPKELNVLLPFIQEGKCPVFCAISMIVSSSAPTIFLPIPYNMMQSGFEGFKNSIWINAPKSSGSKPKRESKPWSLAARVMSHAMANISYSVRIGDNPVLGYLALAHSEGEVVYIPDVSKVRNANEEVKKNDDVLSIATHDEKFMGMASVIYFPLYNLRRLKKVSLLGQNFHKAVLSFWSPSPQFWDHLFVDLPKKQLVYQIKLKNEPKEAPNNFIQKLAGAFSNNFNWLSWEIDKYNFVDKMIAANTTNLMISLDQSFKDASKNEMDVWKSVSHEFSSVLPFMSKETQEAETPLEKAVQGILIGQESSLRRLFNNGFIRKDSFNILLRINGSYTEKFSYDERNLVLEQLPKGINVKIDEKIVKFILVEPLKNIYDYADGIYEIEIKISKNYLSVLYKQKTKEEAINRLTKDQEAFRTYYSLRRGLPINPHSSNYGLGIHLFNTLTSDLKIAKRLYMSPDGQFCWTEIWLPLTHKNDLI